MTNIMQTHMLLLSFILHSQKHLIFISIVEKNILTAMFPVSGLFLTSCLSAVSLEKSCKNTMQSAALNRKLPQILSFRRAVASSVEMWFCNIQNVTSDRGTCVALSRLNVYACLTLCSAHISTNASSESRTIMTPHCTCLLSKKTKS